MKKALIHEWFSSQSCGGAEQCVKSFLSVWDDLVLYSLFDFFDENQREEYLKGKDVNTSFIQKMPFVKSQYKNYFPLFPFAIEQLNLDGFDLILSSSHLVAKGVLSHSNQLHISYVHTPVRYAWDMYHAYLQDNQLSKSFKGLLAKYFLHKLRMWDYSCSNRVDHYICNSKYVAKRINKIYAKNSKVIYPPVDTDKFVIGKNKETFYLTASRLVPYKKIDLIVEAFSLTDLKLLVVGSGPDLAKIKKKASANIELLGYQEDSVLIDLMQKARAFVFAAEEDFGIIPVEVQACGTPVICLNKGGTAETVNGKTGVFFEEQTPKDILKAVEKFEQSYLDFDPIIIRNHSQKFSRKRFEQEISEFVKEKCNYFFN